MYIGAWQEFKLAKILQIKNKVDKEHAEANRLDPEPRTRKPHSMNNRGFGQSHRQDQLEQISNANSAALTSVHNRPSNN